MLTTFLARSCAGWIAGCTHASFSALAAVSTSTAGPSHLLGGRHFVSASIPTSSPPAAAASPAASTSGRGAPSPASATSRGPSTGPSTPSTAGRGQPTGPAAAAAAGAQQASSASPFLSGPRKVVPLLRNGPPRASAGGRAYLEGIVHVRSTFNNIIITLTDRAGNAVATSSAGMVGFKNARKSLPVAAERSAEDLARKSLLLGYGTVAVRLNGMGSNKQYAVQALHGAGLNITQLVDVTPVVYNGCRPRKKRRV